MTIALMLDPKFKVTSLWLRELHTALVAENIHESVELLNDSTELDLVDVALVPGLNPGDLRPFPGLALIQCLWAGVDRLLDDPFVPHGPLLARTVDPAMADQMASTAVAHVLDISLGHHRYRADQAVGDWKPRHSKPLSTKTVGVLGFGTLGRRCAELLATFGFNIIGLVSSRSAVGGADKGFLTTTSLDAVLAQADVVINLLPLTPQTQGVLNAAAFAKMRQGSALINLGRGRHVVDNHLLASLDSGHLSRAVLDVFHTEPLPTDHRYWTHPYVTVTPHVAAETNPTTAAVVVAANIRAFRNGDTAQMTGLVDRARGY